MVSSFRFTLQPYTGRRSRVTCPVCGKPGEFTRYLDTETGELLPVEFGRCNRESNCGHHASPYTAGPGGESFAQLLQPCGPAPAARPAAVAPAAPAPVVSIPADVFRASLGHYERNALAALLQQHFGRSVADELLNRFQLGTSAYWLGACVFWLIDERGRVRGGQVVLYDETGHTVKHPRRCTTWAHTALAAGCQRSGRPMPDWLTPYQQHGQKSPSLFGLPQLNTAPAGQPVAIVESAKTAILCTPYLPGFVWLATMGQSYLTPERLAPVKGRRLVLFPDAGALADWQARAERLRASGFDIQVSEHIEQAATPAERATGLDLADVLLSEWPGYPPSWEASQ